MRDRYGLVFDPRRGNGGARRSRLAFVLAAISFGCGIGDSRTNGDDWDAGDSLADHVAFGADTISFHVDACSNLEERESASPLLTGHAVLDDGRTLRITLLDLRTDSISWQSVGLELGTEYWEARRGSRGDEAGWWRLSSETIESGLGPLIESDDRYVRADGRFVAASGESLAPRDGSVSARCPDE